MSCKSYLRLARVQSTSVTVILCLMGMLIGGGSWTSPIVPLLIAWACLLHWGGMVMNEIFDMKHDEEAGKDFKPMLSGKIKPSSAFTLCLTIQTFGSILGSICCIWNNLALIWMTFSMLSSVFYNFLSKTILKIILLGNIWIGVVLFGYFTQTSEVSLLIILFTGYVGFMFNMDALYVGQYKDPKDKKNLLKMLGATHDQYVFVPSFGTKFVLGLSSTIKAVLAIGIFILSGASINLMVPLLVSILFLGFSTYLLGKTKLNFDRDEAVRDSAWHEIATACVLASSLISILGGILNLAIILVIPVLILVVVNRYLWEKWGVAPKV